jgi:HAD superfamily hydrolase (TIGR01549 family)
MTTMVIPEGQVVEAVSLDCGGVLTVPDHGMLSYVLGRHGIVHDRARFAEGHYQAMAAVDRNGSRPEEFSDYTRAFLHAVGVPEEQTAEATTVLDEVLVPPLWIQRVPGALDAVRRIKAAGYRVAITSNADGTIEDALRRHEIVQVGSGGGIEVEYVGDSGVVGHHKPHPAMFLATASALGLAPERILHVGDAGNFDAEGAAAVGMVGVHLDPLGGCRADHPHVASLAALADILESRRVAGTSVSSGGSR